MITVKRGVQSLVEEAEAGIVTLSAAEVDARSEEAGTLLIDLRDIRELQRDGTIPGAMHVPRGMLEFWIDPESPYYRKEFAEAESLILYCNKGSRSALAAQSLQTMGVEDIAHMAGGFDAWQRDIGRIESLSPRSK